MVREEKSTLAGMYEANCGFRHSHSFTHFCAFERPPGVSIESVKVSVIYPVHYLYPLAQHVYHSILVVCARGWFSIRARGTVLICILKHEWAETSGTSALWKDNNKPTVSIFIFPDQDGVGITISLVPSLFF